MALACEDANSKLVEVVTVADVDSEDHVCNSLLQTRPKPAYGRQGLDWTVRPLGKVIIFRDRQTDKQTSLTGGSN